MDETLPILFKEIASLAREVEVLKNIVYYSPKGLLETIFNESEVSTLSLVIKYPHLSCTSIQVFLNTYFSAHEMIRVDAFRQALYPETLSVKPIQQSHSINQNYAHILQLLIKSVHRKADTIEKLRNHMVKNKDRISQECFQIVSGKVQLKQCLLYLQGLKLSKLQIQLLIAEFFASSEEGSEKYWQVFDTSLSKISESMVQSTLSNSKKTVDSGSNQAPPDHPKGAQILKQLILITLDRLNDMKDMMIKFTTGVPFDVFEQTLIHGYQQFLSPLANQYPSKSKEKYQMHLLKKKDFDMKEFMETLFQLGVNSGFKKGLEIFFMKFCKKGLLQFATIYRVLVYSNVELTFSAASKCNTFVPLVQRYLELLEEQSLIKLSLKQLKVQEIVKIYQFLDAYHLESLSHKELYSFLELEPSQTEDLKYSLISLFGTQEISLRDFVSQLIVYD